MLEIEIRSDKTYHPYLLPDFNNHVNNKNDKFYYWKKYCLMFYNESKDKNKEKDKKQKFRGFVM